MLTSVSAMLAPTLLPLPAAPQPVAASRPALACARHRPPKLFGDDTSKAPYLVAEEYQALAGVWRTDLELDDGHATISLHLAAPRSLGTGSPGGEVHTMLKLPFSICHGGQQARSWSVHRTAHAGQEGEDMLGLSLELGNLHLEGQGERRPAGGLRCTSFAGTVFEGGAADPCVVGKFSMQLALPIVTDLSPLEERYRKRIASQPAPPPAYPRTGFVGRWRLMLSVDDDSPPARFPIELHADRSWQSVGMDQTLAGTWGLYSRDSNAHDGWSTVQSAGSSVWLKVYPPPTPHPYPIHTPQPTHTHTTTTTPVLPPPTPPARAGRQVHRFRSSETLEGVAGLPVRSDFYIEGKPVLESAEQELAARSASDGARDGKSAAGDAPPALLADRVDGRLREGEAEKTYFGRFSLLRGWSEEEAKHAWLARLEAPAWGQREEEELAEGAGAGLGGGASPYTATERAPTEPAPLIVPELERQLVEMQAAQEMHASQEAELARQQAQLAAARAAQAAKFERLQQQLAEARALEAAAKAAAEQTAAAAAAEAVREAEARKAWQMAAEVEAATKAAWESAKAAAAAASAEVAPAAMEVAPAAPMDEAAARAAWLAKREQPSWGLHAAAASAPVVTGPFAATPAEPSVAKNEEKAFDAARAAWLAKQEQPSWGLHAAAASVPVVTAPVAPTPADPSVAKEEEAFKAARAAWLARYQQHGGRRLVTAPVAAMPAEPSMAKEEEEDASEEFQAKLKWLARHEVPTWGRGRDASSSATRYIES